MKYLLQAIEARREHIRLTDPDLRRLLTDVRKGRDEREEFIESIDRILTELRNYTEHSQAFLNRVSKREAPDYYDVIKHPMDLSTMQKKVKAGSYKNKKQFAHDLDLIWDNCLTYNSEPFMRKKANHLLDFVADKSDVKDVLSQWEANEAAAAAAEAAAAAAAAASRSPAGGDTSSGQGAGETGSGTPKGPEAAEGDDSFSSPSLKQKPIHSRRASNLTFIRQSAAANPDVPFEQRPALIRSAEGMAMFDTLDRALSRFEAYAFGTDDDATFWSEPGPSSRPMITAPSQEYSSQLPPNSDSPVVHGPDSAYALAELQGASHTLKILSEDAHTNALDVALRLAPPRLPVEALEGDANLGQKEDAEMKEARLADFSISGVQGPSTSVDKMDVVYEDSKEDEGDGAKGGTSASDPVSVNGTSNRLYVAPSQDETSASTHSSPADSGQPPKSQDKGKAKANNPVPYPNPLQSQAAGVGAAGSTEVATSADTGAQQWGEPALPRLMPDPMAWWTACSTDNMIANGVPALPSASNHLYTAARRRRRSTEGDGDLHDDENASHRKTSRRKKRLPPKAWKPAVNPAAAAANAAVGASNAVVAEVTDAAGSKEQSAHGDKDGADADSSSSTTKVNGASMDVRVDAEEEDEDVDQSQKGNSATDDNRGPAGSLSAVAASTAVSDPAPPATPVAPVIGVREVRGMRAKIEGNIATVMQLRKLHKKFGALATASEIDAPIPAWLTTTSSDEESDDPPSEFEDDDDLETAEPASQLPNGIYSQPAASTSFSKPTPAAAHFNMRAHVQTLLAHVGFEGSHSAPVDVLTHVASDFLLSMGRTLRLYADRCAQRMSAEEMLLHSLRENGVGDIPSLESYIKDDVERYGLKLTELLRKLRQSYKDQLNSTDRGVIQDDALFADDGAAFQSGFFMEELGDDYLGFKALGLDQELGLSGVSVPSRLFHGRSLGSRTAPQNSTAAKPDVPYPPPPPFIPLTSGGVNLQIGLLRDWYRQRLQQRKGDQASRAAARELEPDDDDEDDEDDADDEDERGVLADEEPEKHRIKVPPTGRIPRRTMWDPTAKDAPAAIAGAQDGAGGVKSAGKGSATTGKENMANNSKKRKADGGPVQGKGGGSLGGGGGSNKKRKKDLVAAAA
ncbi:Transcriptional activator spt7 [Tilletia horrida]|uniref:Transcriptional activator spt7 n=1 Tax=Tilletia horrida TaxID=155126 RepID=A0AAN6JXA9_9BASI|nr:Transcriptional activator spt7 [Tilletia horrida]KAK0564470.1 Transcriptional activator spt7 [Tilletia horrida]